MHNYDPVDAIGKKEQLPPIGTGFASASFLSSREDDDPLKKKNAYLFANLGNMLNGSMQLPSQQA